MLSAYSKIYFDGGVARPVATGGGGGGARGG